MEALGCPLSADFVAEVSDQQNVAFVAGRFKPPAAAGPIGSGALTFQYRQPQWLCRVQGDCRRWPDNQLGESAQVLRDSCERELVLCSARAAQSKTTKLQDSLQMRKQHLNTLPVAA